MKLRMVLRKQVERLFPSFSHNTRSWGHPVKMLSSRHGTDKRKLCPHSTPNQLVALIATRCGEDH